MKILIQSLLFVVVIGLFAVTSDRLGKIEKKESMDGSISSSEVSMGDKEFLAAVIEHHVGAIEMAKVAREKSERAEIRDFANDVIAMETSNIDQAYIWRKDWFGESSHVFLNKKDNSVSMIKDLGKKDAQFDLRFLNAMIEHHEGAINMLSDILVPTTRTEIHSLATSSITALSKDIIVMQQWKKEWYGK